MLCFLKSSKIVFRFAVFLNLLKCFLKFACFWFCCNIFIIYILLLSFYQCFGPLGNGRILNSHVCKCSSFRCDSQNNGVAFNTEPPPGTQTGRPGTCADVHSSKYVQSSGVSNVLPI